MGIIGRDLCCRCISREKERAAKQPCPQCGSDRVLTAAGCCIACSRRCTECGQKLRTATATLCKTCRRRAEIRADLQPCPRCSRPGHIKATTGWCGPCSRPRPPKDPPRICSSCGALRRHRARGMCSRCLQRDPSRAYIAGDNLASRLGDPPEWLAGFVVHLAGAYSPARATTILTELGRLLADEHSNHPQSVLDRARRPGRSMGPLARSLQVFFIEQRLALPTDHAEHRAAGRRHRRIEAIPASLRPAVRSYESHLLNCRTRARRAGTRPRSDHTIESALSTIRDFANFINTIRNKKDWATVDISDVEAFLPTSPGNQPHNLTVLRQFFRFARRQHTILIDPTAGLKRQQNKGFRGTTLTRHQQRELFQRWTTGPDVHPHEAVVGLLALLHGASRQEVRLMTCDDIDDNLRTLRLGARPHPVPVDPATWHALRRCLTHRAEWPTANPHVIVTKGTKAGRAPASTAYLSHVLDPCGYPPQTIRNTRLLDLVNTMDAKLVAAAFGMTPEATMIYLADRIDDTRLPNSDRESHKFV